MNAIVKVDAETQEVIAYPLPESTGYTNLNTATFDNRGVLWFTGQSGIYGSFDPATEAMQVYEAPRGAGPYGITTTPSGDVYYASLAGSYVGRIDTATGEATVLEPPTPNQGARRVWSDSQGRVWVAEWNAGQVAVYNPATETWREWPLPGENSAAYAVYVDEQDRVWLTDFGEVRTPWCVLTRRPRPLRALTSLPRERRYGSYSGGPVKCGARRRRRTPL